MMLFPIWYVKMISNNFRSYFHVITICLNTTVKHYYTEHCSVGPTNFIGTTETPLKKWITPLKKWISTVPSIGPREKKIFFTKISTKISKKTKISTVAGRGHCSVRSSECVLVEIIIVKCFNQLSVYKWLLTLFCPWWYYITCFHFKFRHESIHQCRDVP